MNKKINSTDTFRNIGAEVVAWLEAKKPQYTEEIVEEIAKLHDKKNNDYGGAYYEMLNECGTAAGSALFIISLVVWLILLKIRLNKWLMMRVLKIHCLIWHHTQ